MSKMTVPSAGCLTSLWRSFAGGGQGRESEPVQIKAAREAVLQQLDGGEAMGVHRHGYRRKFCLDNRQNTWACCRYDAQRRIVSVNRQFTEYCGRSPEGLLSWRPDGTIYLDDITRMGPVSAHSVSIGERYDHECRYR